MIKGLLLLLGIASIGGCHSLEYPITKERLPSEYIETAGLNFGYVVNKIKDNYGGIKKTGVADVDGDGINDLYFLAADGETMYVTHSTDRLVGILRWYRTK